MHTLPLCLPAPARPPPRPPARPPTCRMLGFKILMDPPSIFWDNAKDPSSKDFKIGLAYHGKKNAGQVSILGFRGAFFGSCVHLHACPCASACMSVCNVDAGGTYCNRYSPFGGQQQQRNLAQEG